VADARRGPAPRLDVQGFELLDHTSAVADLTDDAELRAVYDAEMCELIRAHLGADHVLSRGWEHRSAEPSRADGVKQPAASVHVDYDPDHAAGMFERAFARHFPDAGGYRRAVAVSAWRVLLPPPQDWPLALCDSRTVSPEDGRSVPAYFVDTLPDDPSAPVDHLRPRGRSWRLRFNPGQRWSRFPAMTSGEVLLIKLAETDPTRARATPHTAFHDTTASASAPRSSIEFRAFAYVA